MKKSKIYFIGRKQGFGKRRWRLSHLENRRQNEAEGLIEASNSIVQTRFISSADSIWVRVRPEFTTDKEVERINTRLEPYRQKKIIINDVASFYNYDSKDRTFEIWNKEGIQCPDYLSISPHDADKDIDSTVSKIKKFIDKHEKVFLRTNNETAANGMFLLDSETSKENIIEKLQELVQRCESFLRNRRDTRIVLVQFIMPEKKDGYMDLYRVHLLLGNIFSYYAVTAKLDVFHNCDMDANYLKRFIDLNRSISKIVDTHKNTIIAASQVLGCNLGAIEFFIRDEKPVFLEFNPMWGGEASKVGFGDKQIQSHLAVNKKELAKHIPNIYSFLDYKAYYRKLFESIHTGTNNLSAL